MKIAVFYIAQAEAGWASHSPGKSPAATYLSHQLSTLSARLKNMGHAPYLVDGRSFNNHEHFAAVAKGLEFDVALVWVMPLSREDAAESITAMRRAGKSQPIVAAGPGVSASGERLSDETCDLLGEIDESFPALLEKLSAGANKIPGTIADGLDKPVADVDSLPEIDRGHFNVEVEKASVPHHLLAPPIYTLTVGRGCPACHDATLMGVSFRCARCWTGNADLIRFRARDPRKWVDDVYRLTGSHGTGGVGSIVVHDSHLVDLAWLAAMASDWRDMVRRVRLFLPLDPRVINADPSIVRSLAQCGLTWAHFDVGHGSDRLRRVLGVPFAREEAAAAAEVLKRNRVNLAVRIVSGLPGETDADMDATERMLRELAPTKIDAQAWRPCPGTALWSDANRLALLSNDAAPDGAPHPHVKGYDYARGLRRLLLWPPAYESKIVDLPADQWLAPPPMPAPSAPRTTKNGVPVGVTVQAQPAMLATPTASGKTPPRDDWDAVLARVEEVRAQSAGTRPKVTVITVVHDAYFEHLREALGSIEAQTLREKHAIEHVIIDNGTTRADMAEYLAYKNSAEFQNWRPRVIRFPKNINNIATAWNVALSVARGEYVCFLDADNRRLPKFLEKLVGALDADPQADVAHCKSHIIDAHGNRTSVRGKVKAGVTLAEEIKGNWIDSGEMVIRRSVLARVGVMDERMKACEDWDLVVRLIKAGVRFAFVDEPLCEYRTHAAQRMNTSTELGAGACADLIREKANRRNEWDVRIVTPPLAALTASQRQVIAGITESVKAVEWVRVHDDDGGPGFACDVALVLAPFRLGDVDIEALFRRVDNHGGPRRPQVVAVHMEDPQAIIANSRLLGRADWVVANDYAAFRHYRAKLDEAGLTERAKRVMCWNALGASPRFLRAAQGAKRDVDVLVLGYAYPSRQAIVKAFAKDAPSVWKVACVGDGWADAMKGLKVECVPTADEDATAGWCSRARAILVTHRRQQDIGGFPLFEPESIHRGFLESAAGAVVLVDDVRTFGAGGIEFVRYSDGRDAAKKAFALLKDAPRMAELAEKNGALARGELSMASRVRAILNAIRDERYGVVVP